MKPFLIAFWIGVFGSSCAATQVVAQESGDSRPIQGTSTADWSVEVVTKDLDYPWDIERAGEQILVTEVRGSIVTIDGGSLKRHAVQTSDPIVNEGGGGLLGMALSRDFPSSGVAYLFHTYRSGSSLTNKVIEARFDGKIWLETRVLLAGIPGHRLYNGGRIAIGPDGFLYVTTGWTENRERPQDRSSLAGKVLRMTLDGQVPKDNPFPGSLVYSYGHRNPQGLAWNAAGELFVVEHGQSAHDEINLIKPGANYGWPLIQGSERRAGMEAAWVDSGRDTWAPSGAAFAGQELLVATLRARGLYVLDPVARTLRPVFSAGDRIRDVLPVKTSIYLITTNRSPRADGPSRDRLLKLSPAR